MIKAIIFDFDGLILDTETPEFESFQEMYRAHGCELTLDVWGTCIGTGPEAFNPYDHLESLLGAAYDRESARTLRRERHERKMQDAELRPGVRQYLAQGQEMGLRIGLASSSTNEWVTKYLSRYGLLGEFECLCTRDMVARVKPDPELYLRALAALGVQPHEAIAFEDSPNGTLAAKRAGMFCVTIPNPVTAQLSFGEYDMRLDSMEQLSFPDVVRRFNQASAEAVSKPSKESEPL
ncbi:Validoxylamine A 7'-phosphate phosphatase [Paenibacillus solanacearum]|uniref:Validoxylamine A 7'-phosphate phosphatase n=1 Tax=Paenibacillus solanacearum TaxID=2048548 RepID=A0A916NLD8_9BACL|nr:HAD family hydrolase [Paenibacillus solanacearum]CAG7649555.1 Validoxylamine A 7'-phosphate phosphatase [Paenibacillus solanacearum]